MRDSWGSRQDAKKKGSRRHGSVSFQSLKSKIRQGSNETIKKCLTRRCKRTGDMLREDWRIAGVFNRSRGMAPQKGALPVCKTPCMVVNCCLACCRTCGMKLPAKRYGEEAILQAYAAGGMTKFVCAMRGMRQGAKWSNVQSKAHCCDQVGSMGQWKASCESDDSSSFLWAHSASARAMSFAVLPRRICAWDK